MESPAMRVAPPLFRFMAAMGEENRTELVDAVEAMDRNQQEWIQTLPDGAPEYTLTPSGVAYPLVANSIRYSFGVRTACLVSDWKRAETLANDGLQLTAEFWKAVGGIPQDRSQPVFGHFNVRGALLLERDLKFQRIWALAQLGETERCIALIDDLLATPNTDFNPEDYNLPELLLLRAALEYRLGNTMQAMNSKVEAEQAFIRPVAFSPNEPSRLVTAKWNHPQRPVSVVESWRAYRNSALSLPNRLSPKGSERIWTFGEEVIDPVEKFVTATAEIEAP